MSNDFPPTSAALTEPNGLLAVGGDLSAERLVAAYRRGIFPWFEPGQPILWWTPDPRTVLYPGALHISRSLRRRLRSECFTVSCDSCFDRVVRACAAPRADQAGTWIGPEMMTAYGQLHRAGCAHSIEVWSGSELVGGLYGVRLDAVFFGESMFSRSTDASKVAMVALVWLARRGGIGLIDCQVESAHLSSLGAVSIPRSRFEKHLSEAINIDMAELTPTTTASMPLDAQLGLALPGNTGALL